MKYVMSSQTLHLGQLGFFVVHHWTKNRFDYRHNSSRDYNVHLFSLLPSLMEEEEEEELLYID
jgi:hypothetical protein